MLPRDVAAYAALRQQRRNMLLKALRRGVMLRAEAHAAQHMRAQRAPCCRCCLRRFTPATPPFTSRHAVVTPRMLRLCRLIIFRAAALRR